MAYEGCLCSIIGAFTIKRASFPKKEVCVMNPCWKSSLSVDIITLFGLYSSSPTCPHSHRINPLVNAVRIGRDGDIQVALACALEHVSSASFKWAGIVWRRMWLRLWVCHVPYNSVLFTDIFLIHTVLPHSLSISTLFEWSVFLRWWNLV